MAQALAKSENTILIILFLGSWVLTIVFGFLWFSDGFLWKIISVFGILVFGTMAIVYSIAWGTVLKAKKRMVK